MRILINDQGVHTAHAANINVTDVAVAGDCYTDDPCTEFLGTDCTLQDALDIAECNGEDDTINVAAGFYDADAAGGFDYTAQAGENFDISVIGAGPTTIIDGGDDDQCLEIDTNFVDPDDQVAILVDSITFQNGFFSGPGGGASILTEDGDVTVQNCDFLQNNAQVETGGGLNVVSDTGSIVVNNNNFIGNSTEDSGSAESGGGASLDTNSGSISLNGNFFQGNTGDPGGGLFAEVGTNQNSTITAVNNIFTQNTSLEDGGGGMFVDSPLGTIFITNNTLFNNMALGDVDGYGGGIFAQTDDDAGTINIYNNIVFGNSAEVDGDDIVTCSTDGSPVSLFNNDFSEYIDGTTIVGCETPTNVTQGSNINSDPLFVNSGAADFHLLATSPAIDTGDLAPPNGLPTPDFDGVTRPQGPLPDMGALEFQVIPTPTPTPIPIPTPTPLPSNPLLEGSGLLSCSFHQGLTMIPAQAWTGFLSLVAGLGFLMVLRRKAR